MSSGFADLLAGAAAVAFALAVTARAQDGNYSRDRVLAHLSHMQGSQRGMWNVTAGEGEFLSNLARKLNAKRVLEIGTSNGYSGIWLLLALKDTGGKLITLEIDKRRHSLATANFRAVGLSELVEARLGDALEETPKVEGPLDLVFIDASKHDYIEYLRMVLPKVRTGGAIVAHNVHDMPHAMRDFLDEIKNSPALKTEFVSAGPGGFSVSYRK